MEGDFDYGSEGEGGAGSPARQLEFHDIPHIPPGGGSEGEDDDEGPLLPGAPPRAQPWDKAAVYSLDYYRQFFDVDTQQVVFRIKSSCWPLRNRFLAQIRGRGDLYGPVWVSTTLVFVTAFAAGIVDYRDSLRRHDAEWSFDFTKVSLAATTVYSYIAVVPLLLWALLRWKLTAAPSLLDVLTVYGYSLFVYIPVAIVCIFPSQVDWVSILAAMALSGGVLVINFAELLSTEGKKELLPGVLGLVVAAHVGLTVVLKLYFFQYATPSHPETTAPPISTTAAPPGTATTFK